MEGLEYIEGEIFYNKEKYYLLDVDGTVVHLINPQGGICIDVDDTTLLNQILGKEAEQETTVLTEAEQDALASSLGKTSTSTGFQTVLQELKSIFGIK